MTGVEPMAIIAIHTRYLAWGLLTVAVRQGRGPRIRIDGQEVRGAAWGDNEIPVAPGIHDVEVETRYLLPFYRGTAGMFVTVTGGGRVELEYCAPVVAFAAGSLGPPPQRFRGFGYAIGLIVAVAVVAAVACTVGALFI
jgi:hypothetical protein